MTDPYEGMAPDGTIETGARRDRVAAIFEPVLSDAVVLLGAGDAALYVYGSVVNGSARPGSSDVDLLTIGFRDAATLGERLSARYADRTRGVEVAAAGAADYLGDTDEAYGNRVFLRHYCVHLTGPDPSITLPRFPADARAARGFNGDLDRHLRRWQQALTAGTAAPEVLGVRVARKTLLALAGLVSVHDHTWTTDRSRAVRRWGEIEPGLAAPLERLHSWTQGTDRPTLRHVEEAVADDGIVAAIVERFSSMVGLWTERTQGG